MKLLWKFNVIFVLVFGLGMTAAGYLLYQFLRENARNEVLQQARLMMETALANRDYTTQQIKPLLLRSPESARVFLPQTVPAYGATESFNYLHKTYSDYSYKEATLNPTNLRDRAVDWETDVIQTFRDHPDRTTVTGERDTPTGKSMFLARPIRATQPCLECHSIPKRAPATMLHIYGTANGFGWKDGEIIGAQIVSVPAAVPNRNADRAFQTVLLSTVGVALVTLVMLDLTIFFIVVRPVTQLSAMADRISLGDMQVPEMAVKGSDEIALLTRSFNRMYKSMEKAIRMLEN